MSNVTPGYKRFPDSIAFFVNFECSSIVCKIRKKRNLVKRHSIACSHIWYIDISVCVYWLHTLSIGMCLLITYTINESWKQLNQRNFHNLESHLAGWYIRMCSLIRHKICESFVKKQYFRPRILVYNLWKYPKKHTIKSNGS